MKKAPFSKKVSIKFHQLVVVLFFYNVISEYDKKTQKPKQRFIYCNNNNNNNSTTTSTDVSLASRHAIKFIHALHHHHQQHSIFHPLFRNSRFLSFIYHIQESPACFINIYFFRFNFHKTGEKKMIALSINLSK